MKLIFIYNAKSGWLNGAIDFGHKLFSPATYQCDLCALTYDTLGMKKKWKKFLASTGAELVFLHKDELLNTDFKDITYKIPCILFTKEKNITQIISAQDFKKLQNIDELIEMMKNKIESTQ